MAKAQILSVSYDIWKSVVQGNSFTVYFHEDDGVSYQGTVFAGTDEYIYTSRVVDDTWADFDTTFSGSLVSVSRRDDAVAQIVGLSGVPHTARTSDGKQVISTWPAEGSRKTLISHNWTDPTTWATNSTLASGVDITATTPYQVYELDHTYIIDSYHAKIWEEDNEADEYRFVCEVSTDGGTTWSGVAEEDPHTEEVSGQNGDYTVDYSAGTISFHSPLTSGTQVRAFYYHANLTPTGSDFVITPTAGKSLKLVRAEVQFTTDIILSDTVVFQTYGYVDVFAPQLVNNVDPDYITSFPSLTKIPISKTVYKSMRDYYNEANGAMPTYPALGGSGFRGVSEPIVVLQWDYAAVLPLSFAAGMEVHIYLEHGRPFGGTYATATVYGLSEDE